MDVGRAINYVFLDGEWVKKVAIGGVLLLVPIFGWFVVAGYFLRNVRQVATGADVPLPEWNDFGGDFIRGIKVFLAILVWYSPLILLWAFTTIPLSLANGDGGDVGIGAFAFGAYCVTSILGLVLGFVQPLVITRVAMTDSIGPALDFNGVFTEARQVAVPLIVALVVSWVIGTVASFGIILCFIGLFFTLFLGYVMTSHLYGQIRRQLDFGTPTPATGVSQTPTI